MTSLGRRWCFTLYDGYQAPGNDILQKIKDKCSAKGPITKAIWQEEKCPTTGKHHIQGYVVLATPARVPSVKKTLGSTTVHVELAKGTDQENRTYCSKTESATGQFTFSFGNFEKSQGKRSDLEDLMKSIRENKSMEDLNDQHMEHVIKYHKGIQASRLLVISKSCPTMFERQVIIIWGKSGAGKSLWAREYAQYKNLRLYSKPPGRDDQAQWFDGYDGEECLLLDDFEPSQVPYRELLVWLDVYKHRVQVKGSMVLALWKTVIITSNSDPHDWYLEKLSRQAREPLDRRMDNILKAPEEGWCTEKYPITSEYKSRLPMTKEEKTPQLSPISDFSQQLVPKLQTAEPSYTFQLPALDTEHYETLYDMISPMALPPYKLKRT